MDLHHHQCAIAPDSDRLGRRLFPREGSWKCNGRSNLHHAHERCGYGLSLSHRRKGTIRANLLLKTVVIGNEDERTTTGSDATTQD